MTQLGAAGVHELITRLDSAVALPTVDAVTRQVKRDLEELIAAGAIHIPAAFKKTRPDTYARRLLHRDTARGYTAVVMTWAPGQCTALHDHAGIWCVEGVVEGRMDVTQYDLVDERDGAFRFAQRGCITAAVGSAGALIPPFEYHVLANALDDQSVTLHVYGGEMDHCHVFEPRPGGGYERVTKTLSYHE